MIIRAQFRPWTNWPYPHTRDRRSPWTFKASWPDTLNLLDGELDKLDAEGVTIQTAHSDGDIRLDGWPRANARTPWHPGVIVSFASSHGPLTYASDAHERWDHNVRGIALGLAALRAVDRYGITRSGEQYKGWAALPASTGGPTTLAQAAAVVSQFADVVVSVDDPVAVANAVRRALRKAHPDHGGTTADFDLVQRARRILEASV